MEDQPNRSPQFKEHAKVLGIPVDTIDVAGLFGIMSQMIKNNEKHIICSRKCNGDGIVFS